MLSIFLYFFVYRQVFKRNYAKDAHAHTHTHTVQTDGNEGQCGLTEIFWEEKWLELTFEGRESSRVPDVLGEIVPDVGAKVWESAKAMGFAVEALDFEHACLMKSGERGKDCKGVAAQKDKREQNLWLQCNTCKQFCILSVQKLGASGVAVREVCGFDGVELWEWGVHQYFGLSALVELQSLECPWEENCSSLVRTIHKKLQVILLHLLFYCSCTSWIC